MSSDNPLPTSPTPPDSVTNALDTTTRHASGGKPVPNQQRHVPVENGGDARLYVEVFGAGHSLVLIPPSGLDGRVWDEQIAPFAHHYQVIRYDLRGTGKSDGSSAPVSYTDDTHALLKELQVGRAYLLGLLQGAHVALEYALEFPDQVSALILVAPVVQGYRPSQITPTGADKVAELMPKLLEIGRDLREAKPEDRDLIMERLADMNVTEPDVAFPAPRLAARQYLRSIGLENMRRWMRSPTRPQWHQPSVLERLSEIHIPTLILVGERMGPDADLFAKSLAQGISNARLALIPAATALMNMEQPEAFARMVLTFLQEHEPRISTADEAPQ